MLGLAMLGGLPVDTTHDDGLLGLPQQWSLFGQIFHVVSWMGLPAVQSTSNAKPPVAEMCVRLLTLLEQTTKTNMNRRLIPTAQLDLSVKPHSDCAPYRRSKGAQSE